jgi:signal transduction histidine kinase
MKFVDSRWLKGLLTFRPEPEQQARRIVNTQLRIVLPAKAGIIAIVLFYVFHSDWSLETPSTYDIALAMLKKFFLIYCAFNLAISFFFILWRRFPPGLFQWLVFVLGLMDGLFVAGLVLITDGFQSTAYWIFPGLIILNAVIIPLATPQIVLNLLLGFFYLGAGLLYPEAPRWELDSPPAKLFETRAFTGAGTGTNVNRASRTNLLEITLPSKPEQIPLELDLPRLFVLWLLTACCYGAQVLRRAVEESREFAVREGQLNSAGRLSAEFAHQIKNPLAIINNTVFSLERALKNERHDVIRHLEIIREEVERSDKIITQIMGYAQLGEGHVEKLDLVDELERAIEQTFPAGMESGIHIERHYASYFPPLLMQRQHLAQILVNILQNAREALGGRGSVTVSAVYRGDDSVEVVIGDTGPGISPDKLGKIFEQYYSTKEKGTGLGLAIVKHNVELYAGGVRAESELGKGSRFILTFPAKTVMKFSK